MTYVDRRNRTARNPSTVAQDVHSPTRFVPSSPSPQSSPSSRPPCSAWSSTVYRLPHQWSIELARRRRAARRRSEWLNGWLVGEDTVTSATAFRRLVLRLPARRAAVKIDSAQLQRHRVCVRETLAPRCTDGLSPDGWDSRGALATSPSYPDQSDRPADSIEITQRGV